MRAEHFRSPRRIPVMTARTEITRCGTRAPLVAAARFNTELDAGHVHDLVVVARGPSAWPRGLPGLGRARRAVLEIQRSGWPGGVELPDPNYLGIPMGISGQGPGRPGLSARPEKFGANWRWPGSGGWLRGAGSSVSRGRRRDGAGAHAGRGRTGAAYRKLTVPSSAGFEGNGVYYGAHEGRSRPCSGGRSRWWAAATRPGPAVFLSVREARHLLCACRPRGQQVRYLSTQSTRAGRHAAAPHADGGQ